MKLYRISQPTKNPKFFTTITDVAKFLGYTHSQSLFSLIYYNKLKNKETIAKGWKINEVEINDEDIENLL